MNIMRKLDQISLSSIYKHKKDDRDIFEELMPTKVKEVLLIATLYDSYTIVRDGQFSDKIFGEFLQLNLYTYPRFTSVNTEDDALRMLRKRDFDLVIIMAGMDKKAPEITADRIRAQNKSVPILLLINNNGDLRYFQLLSHQQTSVDRVFVWNGNSNVFLAMVKYIEDKKNIEADTQNGNVRMILLVEDSIQYYSRYLPMLYTSIMTQTQNLMQDEATDDLQLILKMRARPKVVLASNYEEAVKMVSDYKEYLLAVISDVRFQRQGVSDDQAGIRLFQEVRKLLKFPVPLLLQSHDVNNASKAAEICVEFVDKNSESLAQDIHNFIYRQLGFGDFVFKNQDGTPVKVAHNMQEFEEMFQFVSDEVLIYHGQRNSFSTWLMARGEINVAEQLKPYRLDDFKNPEELRRFCLNVFRKVRLTQLRGKVINFETGFLKSNRYISRMGKGSLGGKGRGIAFMCHFIENIDFKKIIPDLKIRIPMTVIIGATEFDNFLEINNLYDEVYSSTDYEHIRTLFMESHLSDELQQKLYEYAEQMTCPLAVRSSGLFEDSLMQPFSGIYATYLISNDSPDVYVRYIQLKTAIKLVYCSIFSDSALSYFKAVDYQIEEEKMAVVIQEVVGHEYKGYYYPSISGVAQSYNYYPVAYMKPEDGFSVAAVGLGMAVVGGENAYRFCPAYPSVNHSSMNDQIRDSQRTLYAIELNQKNIDLLRDGEEASLVRCPLGKLEDDPALEHCITVYDRENDLLIPGIENKGPRVVNFDNILKYDCIPLADTIRFLLRLFRQAMGAPVEMEYAVDLCPDRKPVFYLLQIKPLIRQEDEQLVDLGRVDPDRALLYSKKGMGNGIITTIKDVIWVREDSFDRTKTRAIAEEVSRVNRKLVTAGREYILIGPGRWGTGDPFTGIPVEWAQISNARIIIETALPDFPLEGSLGSHFFHHLTSMNVGYFSIPHESEELFLNRQLLRKQPLDEELNYVRHYHFDRELMILMDGRKRETLIKLSD